METIEGPHRHQGSLPFTNQFVFHTHPELSTSPAVAACEALSPEISNRRRGQVQLPFGQTPIDINEGSCGLLSLHEHLLLRLEKIDHLLKGLRERISSPC